MSSHFHTLRSHLTISSFSKTVESIIVVDMDENEKIIRLVDRWHGKEMPGWFGASFLRVLNAKATPWLIRVPKSSK